MKTSINRKLLSDCLVVVNNLASGSIRFTGGVVVALGGDCLRLTATDLDATVEVLFGDKMTILRGSSPDLETIVSRKGLAALAKPDVLSGEGLDLELVPSGDSATPAARLKLIGDETLVLEPLLPSLDEEFPGELPGDKTEPKGRAHCGHETNDPVVSTTDIAGLAEAIGWTFSVSSNDSTRAGLCGIYLTEVTSPNQPPTGIRIEATDGHRLHLASAPVQKLVLPTWVERGINFDNKSLVACLLAALKLAAKYEPEVVSLFINAEEGENSQSVAFVVKFDAGNVPVVIRVAGTACRAEFPQTSHVYPGFVVSEIQYALNDVGKVLSTIGRLSKLLESGGGLKLSVTRDGLTVTAEGSETGRASAELGMTPIHFARPMAEALVFGVNPRYLAEALSIPRRKAGKGKKRQRPSVSVGMTFDGYGPMILDHGGQFVAVVMPMRR